MDKVEIAKETLQNYIDKRYSQTQIAVELGTTYSYEDDRKIRAKKEILKKKKEKAEELKLQVEVWMISIPFRMQRIIKYKIFEEMTWQQVADRMGPEDYRGKCKKRI